MYSLVKSLPKRYLYLVQAPSLIASLAVAELFYKFGSFLLECVAFLATWFVLDAVLRGLLDLRDRARPGDARPG